MRILEDLAGDCPEDCSGYFLPQNEEKDPATKIRKTSGSSKIKIREKSVLPKTDPRRERERERRKKNNSRKSHNSGLVPNGSCKMFSHLVR